MLIYCLCTFIGNVEGSGITYVKSVQTGTSSSAELTDWNLGTGTSSERTDWNQNQSFDCELVERHCDILIMM